MIKKFTMNHAISVLFNVSWTPFYKSKTNDRISFHNENALPFSMGSGVRILPSNLLFTSNSNE